MKLKDSFITHNINDTQVMVSVDSSFSGMVKSNPTAAFIIDKLKEESTIESLSNALICEYDIDYDTSIKSINYVLDKLRQINALDE